MSGVTLVDAHVHLYEGFDLSRAFDAALQNFRELSSVSDPDVCLCLTEDRHHDVFASLVNFKHSRWRIEPHGDGRSIRVFDLESGAGLWVYAGRQIITAERLEVLALLVPSENIDGLKDGAPLDKTVACVHEAGALPVLPWAFGKWWSSRGQLVSDFARDCRAALCLGDNGGRWKGLGGVLPCPLGTASERVVLPGSDPLPLSGHEDRIGRFGFSIRTGIDESAPADSLRVALLSLKENPDPVGRTAGLSEFLLDQWRLCTSRLPSPASR